MDPKGILYANSMRLLEPPSENAIPAILAEIQSALEKYPPDFIQQCQQVLNAYWMNLSSQALRENLVLAIWAITDC